MSEEKVTYQTVSQFINHLQESGVETVEVSELVETVKEILSNPATAANRRGQLAGLSLEEMTDEQLKREIINAKSVLYKAQQREASIETIEKNQARVDAAMEEKAKRAPVKEEAAEEETAAEDEAVYTDTEI